MPSHSLENRIVDNRYRVCRRLSQGSYAEIYEATDLSGEHRQVVLKVLNTHLNNTPDSDLEQTLTENFDHEAGVLSILRHKNIVQLLRMGEDLTDSGLPLRFMVLEYLAGGDLLSHCRTNPLTLGQALLYFQQVCAALTEAHLKAIIHRDIKPGNLLLTVDKSTVKVADFGIAKTITGRWDEESTLVGVSWYAPPEHNPLLEGRHKREPLTPSADVYALAKTAYTMIVGQSPRQFAGQQIRHLPQNVISRSYGPALLDILRRATSTHVADRFNSVAEFWTQFQTLREFDVQGPKAPTDVDTSGASAIPTSLDTIQTAPRKNVSRIIIELCDRASPPSETRSSDFNTICNSAIIEPFAPLELKASEFDILTLDEGGRVIQRRKGQSRYFVENIGCDFPLEMVEIPEGSFPRDSLGNGAGSYTASRHRISIPPFFIGRFQITQMQWHMMAGLPKINYELDPEPSKFKGHNLPVDQVLWEEAMEFCARLSRETGKIYRLPSESEWEYACRAGTTSAFNLGPTITTDWVNYKGERSLNEVPRGIFRGETIPVGMLGAPNAFGLHDMHGNVWEWCLDTEGKSYNIVPIDGTSGTSKVDQERHIARGGSWAVGAKSCRSDYRISFPSGNRWNYTTGFRVVAVLSQASNKG
jgi:formylglycine-generating enzyme required for sulfatase activity/tRNA A-37 threonylcarbamoyl transferase component Bud32